MDCCSRHFSADSSFAMRPFFPATGFTSPNVGASVADATLSMVASVDLCSDSQEIAVHRPHGFYGVALGCGRLSVLVYAAEEHVALKTAILVRPWHSTLLVNNSAGATTAAIPGTIASAWQFFPPLSLELENCTVEQVSTPTAKPAANEAPYVHFALWKAYTRPSTTTI